MVILVGFAGPERPRIRVTEVAQTSFIWVKGHNENNYRNKRADELANEGREKNTITEMDEEE